MPGRARRLEGRPSERPARAARREPRRCTGCIEAGSCRGGPGACPLEEPGSNCAVPRFSYALLGALALHGLVFSLRARASLDASMAKGQATTRPLELEEFPVEAAPLEQSLPVSPSEPSAPHADPSTPSAVANRVAAPTSKVTSAEVVASPEATPASDALAAPVAVAAGEAGDDAPIGRKIDLGLDGHFFLHDPGPAKPTGPAPASELGPRARKSNAQRQLEAALSADDIQRGLARGNALLGSLSSAARAEGPVRGEAIVRATVGADGSFGSVELLRGSAAEWTEVMSAFRRLAASKHVRLPPGAKGLRVTFSVKAKVQRPSGKETNATAIGVADPSLGTNGLMPNGDFDLADLAGGSQRLVYARVVSEEVL